MGLEDRAVWLWGLENDALHPLLTASKTESRVELPKKHGLSGAIVPHSRYLPVLLSLLVTSYRDLTVCLSGNFLVWSLEEIKQAWGHTHGPHS